MVTKWKSFFPLEIEGLDSLGRHRRSPRVCLLCAATNIANNVITTGGNPVVLTEDSCGASLAAGKACVISYAPAQNVGAFWARPTACPAASRNLARGPVERRIS